METAQRLAALDAGAYEAARAMETAREREPPAAG